MTQPGRTIRIHAIASRAVNPCLLISHSPIIVPVRPSPARQCTATTPGALTSSKKRTTSSSVGVVQSSKYRSKCCIPAFTKTLRSYASDSFKRITLLTRSFLNISITSSGDAAPVSGSRWLRCSGPRNATNFGQIWCMSPFSGWSKSSYCSRSNSLRSNHSHSTALFNPRRQSKTVRGKLDSTNVGSRNGTIGIPAMVLKGATAFSGVMPCSSIR
mmetsp:Transcript_49457/g.75254  ORF Transcript_49457/g.75254 Transcript_49457/m.75254 type:complete len:215 (-) Transcript_49457:633-1277(-)